MAKTVESSQPRRARVLHNAADPSMTKTAHESASAAGIALALFGMALGAAPQTAAQEAATFDQTIEVSLLEVEVAVTSGDGSPVRGLGRDDFVVRVGGKRVEITHFAALEDGELVPARATGDPPSPPRSRADRRNLVIFIDHAHLEPGEIGDVIRALRGFLARAVQPGDQLMVVEANHDLRILQPLTPVPELAVAALDALAPQPPRTHAVSEMNELLAQIERQAQAGPDNLARDRGLGPRELKTRIDDFTIRNHRELEQTTLQLHRLLPALAGLPGRRLLIYVGGTPPTDAGRRLFGAWRSAFGPGSRYQMARSSSSGAAGSGLDAFDSTGGAISETDAGSLFEAVADAANDHDVTLYSLDAGGLRPGRGYLTGQDTPGIDTGGGAGGPTARHDPSRRFGDPQALRIMAEETGGRAAYGSRDFGRALDAVASDLRSHYTLAFPPPPTTDGERLRLDIRLKKGERGIALHHAAHQRPRSTDYRVADETIAALLLGATANPLDVLVFADTARAVGKGWSVPLTITVPIVRLTLLEDGEARRGQLSLFLVAGDLTSGAGEVQKAIVPLSLAAGTLTGDPDQRLEYPLDLPITAGARSLAITVRDDLHPLSGTVRIAVPPPPG